MRSTAIFIACILIGCVCSVGAHPTEEMEGLDWPMEPFVIKEPEELPAVFAGYDLSTDASVFEGARHAADLAAQGQMKEAMHLLYWAIQRRPETYGYEDMAAMFAVSNAPNTAIYWLQRCAWAEGVNAESIEKNRNFDSVTSDARWPQLKKFFADAAAAWERSSYHNEVLVVPKGYQVGETVPLVLFLHGQGGTPERMLPQGKDGSAAQEMADRYRVALLAVGGTVPVARYSYHWTNDLVRDRQHLMKAIDHVKDRVTPDLKRLSIVGFSRGAQEGIEIAVRHPDQFGSVFVICPGTVAGCRLDAVQPVPNLTGKRFLIIRGDQEGAESQAVAQADARYVEAAGAKVAYQDIPGMGHTLPPDYIELVNSWIEVNFGNPAK